MRPLLSDIHVVPFNSFFLKSEDGATQVSFHCFMAYADPMRFMGIDYGSRRVGVALSDESGTLAFPEATLVSGPKLAEEVASLAKTKGVERIILGESLDFKNRPNKIMEAVSIFKNELETVSGLSVIYEHEMMTSAAAARLQGGGNHDASAAALILQSYLDKIKNTTHD